MGEEEGAKSWCNFRENDYSWNVLYRCRMRILRTSYKSVAMSAPSVVQYDWGNMLGNNLFNLKFIKYF